MSRRAGAPFDWRCDACGEPIRRGEPVDLRGALVRHAACAGGGPTWPALFGVFAGVALVVLVGVLALGLAVRGLL